MLAMVKRSRPKAEKKGKQWSFRALIGKSACDY